MNDTIVLSTPILLALAALAVLIIVLSVASMRKLDRKRRIY